MITVVHTGGYAVIQVKQRKAKCLLLGCQYGNPGRKMGNISLLLLGCQTQSESFSGSRMERQLDEQDRR